MLGKQRACGSYTLDYRIFPSFVGNVKSEFCKFVYFDFPEFALEQGGLSAEVIRKAFDATEEDFVHLVKRSWVAQPQIAR